MRTRLVSLATLGALLLTSQAVDPLSHAASGSPGETTCHGSYDAVLSPGLTTRPSVGSAYTLPGATATCDGPVLGRMPSGPAAVVDIAHLGTAGGDDCVSGGQAWGAIEFRFPTSDGGTIQLVSPSVLKYGGLAHGLLTGVFQGDYLDGTFTVVPEAGDCLTAPITRGRVSFVGTLHDFDPGRARQ